MAEPRFNNPYFWPPPPSMPGQVSVTAPAAARHLQPFVASLIPRVNALPAVKLDRLNPFSFFFFFKSTKVDIFWVFFPAPGWNGVRTWRLFAVEHDPLTLSAG